MNDTTKQRHAVIFNAYLQVISQKGEDARFHSKGSLYDEVARITNYSPRSVSKVITRTFREKDNVK